MAMAVFELERVRHFVRLVVRPSSGHVGVWYFYQLYWYYEVNMGSSCYSRASSSPWHLWSVSSYIFQSAVSYWVCIYIWCCFVPPAAQTLPLGIPSDVKSLLWLMTEVASGLVGYDFIFFWIHWALHACPALRHVHALHHGHGCSTSSESSSLESRHVLRHGFGDAALQVLVNILVQRRVGVVGPTKSRVARILHNVLVVWWLTEAHSAAPYPYIWRRWLVGVREHRQHHFYDHNATNGSNGCHRYQQFFGYLDDARFWWLRRQQQQQSQRPGLQEQVHAKKNI